MKSMLMRSTAREIKNSLGRYLAIFGIVALGVGLFAGLKITKTIMVKSANEYLENSAFYDYQLLSTYGFEDEDIEVFRKKEGVRAVCGSYSADVVVRDDAGNESVVKMLTLSDEINTPVLVAGRLPATENECLADANMFGKDAIGKTIVLAESNLEEDLENFTYKEYTITGTAKSPLYIQFERGTTSLGNGRIVGFVYLLPEGFAMDYYSEVYVKLDSDYFIYSEEYKNDIDAQTSTWELYCEEAGNRRYESIMDEAYAELDDAKQTLEEERTEAENELADAKRELEDAKAELEDAEAELKDAKKKLEDGEIELKDGWRELKDAREEINKNRADLDAKEQEILAAKAQIAGYESMFPEKVAELACAEAAIAEGRRQLDAAEAELLQAGKDLEQAQKELEEGWIEYEDGLVKYEDGCKEYEDGYQEYEDGYQEFVEEIAEAEAEVADAEAEIADIDTADTYVLDRMTNIGYACFESDSAIVHGIANVFPVFFFLVAALVCMTTMNRMVEEQRTQIGVLKSQGYSDAKIMGKYLFYSGSASVTGCLLGYFGGTYIFPLVIWIAYQMIYQMGAMEVAFDGTLLLISFVGALACTMGVTFVSLRKELKEVAASLMRPKAPKAGKRVFLEKMSFIWKHLSFLQKVSVRNILRYKKRFFMMIVGISGCTALMITGFGVKDSVTGIAENQFERIQTYDLDVSMKNGVESLSEEDIANEGLAELLENPYLKEGDITLAYETTIDLVVGDRVKSVSMVVAENPEIIGDFIHLYNSQGEPISYPEKGELVLCEKLANRYELQVGDTVRLVDEDRNTMELTLSGICQNYIYNYVYVHPDTYREYKPELRFKNILVNLEGRSDEEANAASASIMQSDKISIVTMNKDIQMRITNMLDSMNFIVIVIIICAAALAFIVLYNLNNINITERIREIATIKVLGFYKKETAAYVFRENIVLTAFGAALGILLGKWLHAFVMGEIDVDMVFFEVKISLLGYVLSIVLTFGFNWIVNLFMSGKLENINMAESLKSVD